MINSNVEQPGIRAEKISNKSPESKFMQPRELDIGSSLGDPMIAEVMAGAFSTGGLPAIERAQPDQVSTVEQTHQAAADIVNPVQEKVDQLDGKLDQVLEGQQRTDETMQKLLELMAQQQGEINALKNRAETDSQRIAVLEQKVDDLTQLVSQSTSESVKRPAAAAQRRQETNVQRTEEFTSRLTILSDEQKTTIEAQLVDSKGRKLAGPARTNKGLRLIQEMETGSPISPLPEEGTEADGATHDEVMGELTEGGATTTQPAEHKIKADLSVSNPNRQSAAEGVVAEVALKRNLNLSEEQIQFATARLLEEYRKNPDVVVDALLQESTQPGSTAVDSDHPAPAPSDTAVDEKDTVRESTEKVVNSQVVSEQAAKMGVTLDQEADRQVQALLYQDFDLSTEDAIKRVMAGTTTPPATPASQGTHKGITPDGNFYAPVLSTETGEIPKTTTPNRPTGPVEVNEDLIKRYARMNGATENELLEQYKLGTLSPQTRQVLEGFASSRPGYVETPYQQPVPEPASAAETTPRPVDDITSVIAAAEGIAQEGVLKSVGLGKQSEISTEAPPPLPTTIAELNTRIANLSDQQKASNEEQKQQGRWNRRTLVAVGAMVTSGIVFSEHPELIQQAAEFTTTQAAMIPELGNRIGELLPNISTDQWAASWGHFREQWSTINPAIQGAAETANNWRLGVGANINAFDAQANQFIQGAVEGVNKWGAGVSKNVDTLNEQTTQALQAGRDEVVSRVNNIDTAQWWTDLQARYAANTAERNSALSQEFTNLVNYAQETGINIQDWLTNNRHLVIAGMIGGLTSAGVIGIGNRIADRFRAQPTPVSETVTTPSETSTTDTEAIKAGQFRGVSSPTSAGTSTGTTGGGQP